MHGCKNCMWHSKPVLYLILRCGSVQGCLVQWNPTESTFDCPCHGSYFDCHGKVCQGPANADLQAVELKTFGVQSAQ